VTLRVNAGQCKQKPARAAGTSKQTHVLAMLSANIADHPSLTLAP
jgi:hypothetical protein